MWREPSAGFRRLIMHAEAISKMTRPAMAITWSDDPEPGKTYCNLERLLGGGPCLPECMGFYSPKVLKGCEPTHDADG